MSDENDTTETTEQPETGKLWDGLNDKDREWYLAGDITADSVSTADMSRAWKVLAVFRDIALGQSPIPDFERAVLYSHVMNDFATMLTRDGWPIPSTDGKTPLWIDQDDLSELEVVARERAGGDDGGEEAAESRG